MAIFSSIPTIIITIFIFGLLIFIHELGHYIAARKSGVGIIEFAIGMGPKIYSWEGKVNTFSIRALPIGGFVSMVGEYSEDIEEKDKNKVPLEKIPVWKRIIIALSGPLMNILLGFFVMLFVVISTDIPSTVVAKFDEGSLSSQYGLEENDEIIEVDGKRTRVYTDMSYKIMADGINPLDITVLRNGEKVYLNDVQFEVVNDNGINFGSLDFRVYAKEKSLGNTIHQSFFQSISIVYMTIDQLIDVIGGRYGVEAVSGPVGIGEQIGEVVKTSEGVGNTVRNLATIVIFISISLGIFNLLPIPVLDGGMILFAIIELIRRKPLDKKIERSISAVFMMLLLALTVVVFFKDIVRLFN